MIPDAMLLDYEILRLIWWVLLGVLLIGFAIMDGFDMGVAMLLPILGKTDTQRRVMLNSIGPVWEGNQVWLVLGAGAIFAAWPMAYAVAFSGFYSAMFLTLLTLILRPVGFDYRNKVNDPRWRTAWDYALVLGGFVPALVFGVAFGNLMLGVPFHFDIDLRSFYEGGFFGLLHPFAVLCGLVSIFMLMAHGAIFLTFKADESLTKGAQKVAIFAAAAVLVLFSIGGIWVGFIEFYQISSDIASDGPSNPLNKEVIREAGALLNNYSAFPLTILAPVLGYLGFGGAIMFLKKHRFHRAFIASAIGLLGVISTAAVSLFPFLMPSSKSPSHSLTVWDASSSQLTLFVMLIAVLLFFPLVVAYTAWVYRVLKGRVSEEYVNKNSRDLY